MSTCINCGQPMPTFIDPFNLTALRSAVDVALVFWEDVSVGDTITIPKLPADAVAKIVDAQVESDWDSYGDAVGSGYVVFSIEYSGVTKTYKLEGTQDSYSGWNWQTDYVAEVSATPKTVTVWESV